MTDEMYYDKVKALVKNDANLLEKLIRVVAQKFRSGPKTPDFAFAKHKETCYLSGISYIYLRKLVKDSEKSKSQVLEEIIRLHIENNEGVNNGF